MWYCFCAGYEQNQIFFKGVRHKNMLQMVDVHDRIVMVLTLCIKREEISWSLMESLFVPQKIDFLIVCVWTSLKKISEDYKYWQVCYYRFIRGRWITLRVTVCCWKYLELQNFQERCLWIRVMFILYSVILTKTASNFFP